MEPNFTMTAFTPSEAAAITGVSTDLQRDWRRRGYLLSGSGHARFDLFDLARMLTMQLLAARGIGPQQSVEIAEWCALGIARDVLAGTDAWEGEPHLAPIDFSIPKIDETGERLAEKMPETERASFLEKYDARWGARQRYLINSLWRMLDKPRVIPGKCFVWWADDSHSFEVSFDDAIGNMFSSDPKTQGPMVVLEYFSLSTLLMERAGRAFCHIEFEDK